MTHATIELRTTAHIGPARIGSQTLATLKRWHQRARQRTQLGALTPEQLRDLGITFDAARAEVAKPFWRA